MKNWKTTACAISMLVAVLCGGVAVPLLDGNPATTVDWAYVTNNAQAALLMLGIAVPSILGLLFAADAKKPE